LGIDHGRGITAEVSHPGAVFPRGRIEIYDDIEPLGTDLEFFDSEDPEGGKVEVTDCLGRRVIPKVWNVGIKEFRLAP
jgi:hypothetical protein